MGIKNMLKFLNTNYPNIIHKIESDNFNHKMIAIDISILLYQVIIAIRNSGADMIILIGKAFSKCIHEYENIYHRFGKIHQSFYLIFYSLFHHGM